MRITRIISYPATLMVIIAGAYTVLRVAPGERGRVFAMLAITAIGATEMVQAAVVLFAGTASRQVVTSTFVIGIGSLITGFSLLNGLATIPFVAGTLTLTVGFVLRQRSLTTHA